MKCFQPVIKYIVLSWAVLLKKVRSVLIARIEINKKKVCKEKQNIYLFIF